jgi:hypothetical protein
MSSDTQRVDWDALGALASAQSKAVVTELLNDAFECRHQHSGLTLSRRARLQSELGLPDAAAAVDRVRLLLPASTATLNLRWWMFGSTRRPTHTQLSALRPTSSSSAPLTRLSRDG